MATGWCFPVTMVSMIGQGKEAVTLVAQQYGRFLNGKETFKPAGVRNQRSVSCR